MYVTQTHWQIERSVAQHSECDWQALLGLFRDALSHTAGDKMRYTWANDNETWFGFWHFEIVATIAYLLKNQAGIPDGIDPILMRKRMVETVTWLNNNVR